MDLLPTLEQEAIATAAADFLDGVLAGDTPPAGRTAARGRRLWKECAAQGFFDLGLGEDAEGAGLSVVEEVLLFEQVGRRLSPGPLVGGVLAARLAASAGDADLLGHITDGTLMVGTATPSGASVEVSTSVTGTYYVVDAGESDLALVLGHDRIALVAVAGEEPDEELHSLDPDVRIVRRSFRNEPVAVASGEAERLAVLGTILVSASLCGIAAAALEQSVAHVAAREQFGRPVGGFQAVKHRCADMAVRAEAARALSRFAAVELAEGTRGAWQDVSAARMLSSTAALQNSAANILNHGALGFTAAHGADRLLKRSHLLAETLGSIAVHRKRVVAERAALPAGDEAPW